VSREGYARVGVSPTLLVPDVAGPGCPPGPGRRSTRRGVGSPKTP
jgi:hypothetical protein